MAIDIERNLKRAHEDQGADKKDKKVRITPASSKDGKKPKATFEKKAPKQFSKKHGTSAKRNLKGAREHQGNNENDMEMEITSASSKSERKNSQATLKKKVSPQFSKKEANAEGAHEDQGIDKIVFEISRTPSIVGKQQKPKGKFKKEGLIGTRTKQKANLKVGASISPKVKSRKNVASDSQPLHLLKTKDRRTVRKSLKNNYEMGKQAKRLWETIRREDCPKEKQQQLCDQVYTLIKDQVSELVLAHDTARVIECLIAYGSDKLKSDLFGILKGNLVSLMSSKYAKYVVEKFLKDGNKQQRNDIIQAMYGHCKRLISHSEAAHVVELAYNDYANATQRSCLVEEFYGVSFALFKDLKVKSLAQILESQPEQKTVILEYMKSILTPIVNKSVINYSIVHHVLLEYLTNCNPKDRTEMIQSLQDKVLHILHTKNGARIGMHCIWHGTTKDRRIIVKSFKTHVQKICLEEHGHMVLISIFDCVDDTVLVQKAIIDEMGRTIATLPFDAHGRKVLLFLLAPRHSLHFHPDIIKILAQGDGNSTSKKDPELRRKELLTAVSKYLLALSLETIEAMVFSPSANVVLQAILMNCIGDTSHFLKLIAEMAARPLETEDEKHQHIVEHTAGHLLLKRLIQHDKERCKDPDKVLFCDILLSSVPTPTLQSWINCNRAAFILVLLLDTGILRIVEKVRQSLQPVMSTLSDKKSKGAELLYSKLNT